MQNDAKQAIESLGLKSEYIFKQARIPTSGDAGDMRHRLITVVAPAIRELEAKSLINGFYHVIHDDIDLSLSCGDWEENETAIKEVLSRHAISTELVNGGNLYPDDYGGDAGAALTENNLELNSRLVLLMLEVINGTDDESMLELLDRQCPHQWIHQLCNQFGLNNLQESVFDFNNAMVWLETIMRNNMETPEIVSEVRRILDYFKGRLGMFEDTYFGDKNGGAAS